MIQITNTKLRVLQSFKYLLWLLLLISIFKNISYPLMWADESMTAMGSERVLSYGYPKINDGKNTLYDLLHPNKRLGANEKMDAYIGGAGWLQYYYGTIGCSIANKFSDIYVKTGILRSSFAIVGVFGLFILMQFLSKLIKDKVTSEVFKIAFLVLTISSISLILLIKEVRYFALVFLIFNSILACYFMFRFNKRYNEKLFITLMAILHPLCIITFSPIYFILLASIGCIEVILFI
ncbi:MAG TPA: hypothetical protein PKD85_15800, partial [Saprospiraceae bacterium]|nr:hypothetical protein [Saprospiraceae bacterium]